MTKEKLRKFFEHVSNVFYLLSDFPTKLCVQQTVSLYILVQFQESILQYASVSKLSTTFNFENESRNLILFLKVGPKNVYIRFFPSKPFIIRNFCLEPFIYREKYALSQNIVFTVSLKNKRFSDPPRGSSEQIDYFDS